MALSVHALVCLLIAALAFTPLPLKSAPAPTAKADVREGYSVSASVPYMQLAIDEALNGITCGDGGPFGAVIVKDGQAVGSGHNMVLRNNDPTCHGEVAAIRDACDKLGTYDLSGCEIYTTGEPCPMCLYACLWANIGRVYYGCTIEDNSVIGFRDEAFDSLTDGREQLGDYLVCIDRDACLELFAVYAQTEHIIY